MPMFNKLAAVTVVSCTLLVGCFGEGVLEGPPTEYDTTRLYYLPWPYGQDYGIIQGPSGGHGHKSNHLDARGEYAFDAKMAEGTPISAARSGYVPADGVIESHNYNCPNREPAADGTPCVNNLVRINHDDGSYGEYLHIGLNAACVEPGDIVSQGDIIAYSGHVGVSFTPHLHFHVGNTSTPPNFVDVDNNGTGVPEASTGSMPMYASANQVGRNFCAERGISFTTFAQ